MSYKRFNLIKKLPSFKQINQSDKENKTFTERIAISVSLNMSGCVKYMRQLFENCHNGVGWREFANANNKVVGLALCPATAAVALLIILILFPTLM